MKRINSKNYNNNFGTNTRFRQGLGRILSCGARKPEQNIENSLKILFNFHFNNIRAIGIYSATCLLNTNNRTGRLTDLWYRILWEQEYAILVKTNNKICIIYIYTKVSLCVVSFCVFSKLRRCLISTNFH